MLEVLTCLHHQHDPRLVAAALVVCACACVATFSMFATVPELGRVRRAVWIAMCGLVAGAGVWTTHFVAMLAFRTGLPTGYAPLPTLASLLIAVAAATGGFRLAADDHSQRGLGRKLGGVVLGLGIAAMHYVGMSGYETMGQLVWDPTFVAASVALGVGFSIIALSIGRVGSPRAARLTAAAAFAAAIGATHFTGMAAVTLLPDNRLPPAPSLLSTSAMAALAVGGTVTIIAAALGAAMLDHFGRVGALRRLREALNAMPDGIAIFDAADRLVAWNTPYDALCRDAGSTPAPGLPFDDMIREGLKIGAFPDAAGRETAWLAERRAAHDAMGAAQLQRTNAGRWLQVTERRTRDGGCVVSCVDITALKVAEAALAESEERFRRMAETAPDIIAESRLDGTMTYLSPAALPITGFRADELVGRRYADLMEAEDGERVGAMCQAVFASRGELAPWPVEFRAGHKDGRELWLECKPTLVKDPVTGQFTGLTDIIRDITPRKELEAALRSARADAEAAATVKGEFLANTSHELRTPLTSIIGFTEFAAAQPDLSDRTRSYVERISVASRALLCTVNDILDFSKLEAGQVVIHRRPVRPVALAQSALELLEPQAGAKKLQLALDPPSETDMVLDLDPDRLGQVLMNLIGNAVKFTEAGSVTLRLRHDAAGERLRAEVIDTGPGLTGEQAASLFRRFAQVDGSLTRNHGGTGLGLAICKGLVEAMGGRIGVDSRPGRGSCFWFDIAAPSTGGSEAEEGPTATASAVGGARILVADDHATNRELARLFLEGMGAEVQEAADGEQAVELAERQPFDAILMDLRMPRLGGLDALRRIRAGGGPNVATPVLAFTADATADVAAKLCAAGFFDVIAKPIAPAELMKALTDAIASSEDQGQSRADIRLAS